MANRNPSPATRFKPGIAPNPKGRPSKGYSITETIREMMGEKPEIKKALSTKVLEMALKGDMTAIKLLWSYMDGQPQQSMDVTTDGKALPTPIYGGKSKV
jgi:hypothetical protein